MSVFSHQNKAGGLTFIFVFLTFGVFSLFAEQNLTAVNYAYFLNAVASNDPHGLYHEKMGSDLTAAVILRSGLPGSYCYQVIDGKEDTLMPYLTPWTKTSFCSWADHEGSVISSSEENICATRDHALEYLENRGCDLSLASNDSSLSELMMGVINPLVAFNAGTNAIKDFFLFTLVAFSGPSMAREGNENLDSAASQNREPLLAETEDAFSSEIDQAGINGKLEPSYQQDAFGLDPSVNVTVTEEPYEPARSSASSASSFPYDHLVFLKPSFFRQPWTRQPSKDGTSVHSSKFGSISLNSSEHSLSSQESKQGLLSVTCPKCCDAFSNCFRKEPTERHPSREPLLEYEEQRPMMVRNPESVSTEMTEQPLLPHVSDLTMALRREVIDARGYLHLTPEDFTLIAGTPRGYLSSIYRMTEGLKHYKNNKNEWDIPTKMENLNRLEQEAKACLGTKDNALIKSISSFLDKARAAARIKACTLLLRGIAVEKFALIHQLDADAIRFKPERVIDIIHDFDAGEMSSVKIVSYHGHRPRVFKSVDEHGEMNAIAAANMGIPSESTLAANIAGRSVATYELARLLNLSTVPKTELALLNQGIIGFCQLYVPGEQLFKTATHRLTQTEVFEELKSNCAKGEKDNAEEFAEFCIGSIAMSVTRASIPRDWKIWMAPSLSRLDDESPLCENGVPITEERALELFQEGHLAFEKKVISEIGDEIDFSDPNLQKSMSEAHSVTLLNGDTDKHSLNMVFAKRNQQHGTYWSVYLIDNDLSFPSGFRGLSQEQLRSAGDHVLKKLPRLIDQQTAENILGLTPERLRNQLLGTSLTEEELEATEMRLHDLQKHINDIKNNRIPGGKLVTQWNKETFELLKQKVNGEHDNYISRSLEDREIKRRDLNRTISR